MKNKIINKNILITGGTGFIGQNLLPRLIKEGYKVILLVKPGGTPKGCSREIKIIRDDLTKNASSIRKINKIDVIIHLAGLVDIDESLKEPEKHIELNLLMLLNVLGVARAMKKAPLFIFSSTDRLYGRTGKSAVDETEPAWPIEPYTASKILGEKIVETYHHLYGIPYIILRIDSIYGPHQPSRMFISDVINKMLRGEKIITGGLDVRKNFVYAGDLIEAFLATIKSSTRNQNNIYNVGGTQHSLKEALAIIDKMMEKKTGRKNFLAIKSGPIKRDKKNEVNPFLLSRKKILKKLHWEPRVALAEGINNTINYFMAQYEK